MQWKFYFCVLMEQTNNLKYLKGIVIAFMTLYILLVLLNFLETIWHGTVQFMNGISDFWMYIKYYEGKVHFCANIFNYLLFIIFLIIANRFVKEHDDIKGYHFLIVIIAFLPLINYVLLYIVWRRLNKQIFIYCDVDWRNSNRKIKVIWILEVISIIYLISFPFLMSYLYWLMPVSKVSFYLSLLKTVGKIYYLIVSVLYLFYFMELKRLLNWTESKTDRLNNTSLLDD